jgi:hypothetical protein
MDLMPEMVTSVVMPGGDINDDASGDDGDTNVDGRPFSYFFWRSYPFELSQIPTPRGVHNRVTVAASDRIDTGHSGDQEVGGVRAARPNGEYGN